MSRCKKFLVSYGSSGQNITPQMFDPYPEIKIDECYTLSQRDLKYTLFHSRTRLTKPFVSSVLKDLEKKYEIICAAVFGYDEIVMGDEIDLHPGFKKMVELMNAKYPSFESWMTNGSLETNVRGILYKHLSHGLTGTSTKSRLLHQIEVLRRENKTLQEKTSIMETLGFQNEELKRENEALRSEIGSLRFKLEIMEIANRPRRKRQEPEAAAGHPTETHAPLP